MPPLSTAGNLEIDGGKSTWRVKFDPPFTAFARRFDRFAETIEDATAVWEAMADSLEHEVEGAFQSEGSSTGAQWHPLSRRYAVAKARRFPGKGILEATGALRESFRQGGSGHVREIRPRSFVWGSTIPYGVYHQAGGRIPRRPILRLTSDVKDDWERIIHKFIIDSKRATL